MGCVSANETLVDFGGYNYQCMSVESIGSRVMIKMVKDQRLKYVIIYVDETYVLDYLPLEYRELAKMVVVPV